MGITIRNTKEDYDKKRAQINLGSNNKKHKEDVASNRYPTNEFLESLSGLRDDKVIDIGL